MFSLTNHLKHFGNCSRVNASSTGKNWVRCYLNLTDACLRGNGNYAHVNHHLVIHFHDLRMKSGDFRNQEKWPPLSLSFQLAGPLQTKPEAWEDDREKDKGEVNHIHIIYVYIYTHNTYGYIHIIHMDGLLIALYVCIYIYIHTLYW